MQLISGRAVDYRLDRETSMSRINSGLTKAYTQSGFNTTQTLAPDSFIDTLSIAQVRQLYPMQNRKLNLIQMLEDELTH